MNLRKLSPGFGRCHAAGQLPTPSALSPRSVHPPGHRDGGGTVQLRGAGHAGALAARGRRGEDLQQDWRGPGMVEGGNQRKSECIQIMSCPISAAPGPPRQPAVRTAKGRGTHPTPSYSFLARLTKPTALLLCDSDTRHRWERVVGRRCPSLLFLKPARGGFMQVKGSASRGKAAG